MTDVIRLERRGDIALILVNNPPVNALSAAVRQGLAEAVARLADDPEARIAVLFCAGRTFIAGADISEFGKPPVPPASRSRTRCCRSRSARRRRN